MASDDPAKWLRQLADGILTDPEIPPGVVVMESGTEQIAWTASHPGGLVTGELREDLSSFAESFPYFIRMDERGEPVRCECCGTLVALTPEALGVDGPWKPGIWEHESLRRHTMRRCEWMRARSDDTAEHERHRRGDEGPGELPRPENGRRRRLQGDH